MGLASLAAEYGSKVEIEVDGPDEDTAAKAVVYLIEVELGLPEQDE
jgi:phosphotransferase system HPr-like phosphotransfer protein